MKFLALFCIFSFLSAFANEGVGEQFGKKVGKKVDKTVDDVSDYSKEQKDKIQKEFKAQMKALDKEIADIKTTANKIKTTASEETNKQINDQIAFLEKQRSELASDFNSLQASSGRAWDRIKNGIQDSVGTLKESFKKAKQEFQSDERK